MLMRMKYQFTLGWMDLKEELKRLEFAIPNQLPTIDDKKYVSESADGMHFIGPLLQKAYYMRPFVVTKDNDTIYGYVQRIQYSR